MPRLALRGRPEAAPEDVPPQGPEQQQLRRFFFVFLERRRRQRREIKRRRPQEEDFPAFLPGHRRRQLPATRVDDPNRFSLDAEPGPKCEDDAAAAAAGGLLSPVGALVARARGGKVVSSSSHSSRRRSPSNPSDPAALVGGRCSLFARKFKDDVRWRVKRGVVALAAEDELEAFPASS